jgi:excisionase family DNA binding protein
MANFLTLDEAAAELRVGRKTIMAMVRAGMPTVRPGKEVLVHRAALDAWVLEHPGRACRAPVGACAINEARRAAAEADTRAAAQAILLFLPGCEGGKASVREMIRAGVGSRRAVDRAVRSLAEAGRIVRGEEGWVLT